MGVVVFLHGVGAEAEGDAKRPDPTTLLSMQRIPAVNSCVIHRGGAGEKGWRSSFVGRFLVNERRIADTLPVVGEMD